MKLQMPADEQKRLESYQKRMRRRPTKAEAQFKKDILRLLKGRYGIKSISQKMIWEVKGKQDKKAYILDFYLPDLKMSIEIDGNSHNSKQAKTYDQIRDSLAAKRGIRVIRFSNEEVKDSEKCIRRLYAEIEQWQEYNLKRSTQKILDISRDDELRMQEEFIEAKGLTLLPEIGFNRKALSQAK